MRTPASSLIMLLLALALGTSACDADLSEPRGEIGVLGIARFTHDLEGPLGATPLAVGARFVLTANRDGCDRLTETECDPDTGALLVRASDPTLLEITPRADGAAGALAATAGSTVLFAVDGTGEVIDFLDLQIARPVAVALTDQALSAYRPRALPLAWAVEAKTNLELRSVVVDRDHRVLLTGDPTFIVEIELRDVDEDLRERSGQVFLGPPASDVIAEQVRVRAPDRATTFRAVVFASDRSLDATVYRISVLEPATDDRMRVEVGVATSRPGFDVVTVDLCAVRERFDAGRGQSLLMLGHGYSWRAPWGFEILDLGIGDFPGPGPEGARCVRAVRFDDREVPPSDRFYAKLGPSEGSVPMGVALGQVKRPKPWWAPLWEGSQALFSGE